MRYNKLFVIQENRVNRVQLIGVRESDFPIFIKVS